MNIAIKNAFNNFDMYKGIEKFKKPVLIMQGSMINQFSQNTVKNMLNYMKTANMLLLKDQNIVTQK